jgi:DNA primase
MNNEYWNIRVNKIKEKISLRSLIDKYHIDCQSHGEITQVHCPFHGSDNHASARIYETNTMYCWVCSKSWDVISFTKDYEKLNSFSDACKFLERNYNIDKTDFVQSYQEPSFEEYLQSKNSDEFSKERDFENDFNRLYRMLIRNKDRFNLNQYSKYFYYIDNLYANYKINNYDGDISLNYALKNIHEEIYNII